MQNFSTENSPITKNLLSKATLPQVQEYHHTDTESGGKGTFLELTYRAEAFIPTPINDILPIHF